jgi:hypothetical protein
MICLPSPGVREHRLACPAPTVRSLLACLLSAARPTRSSLAAPTHANITSSPQDQPSPHPSSPPPSSRRSAALCSPCFRVLFASHTLVSAPAASNCASLERLALIVRQRDAAACLHSLCIALSRLSQLVVHTTANPVGARAAHVVRCTAARVLLLLARTPRTPSTHRSRTASPTGSLLPSSQNGRWRRQRPGFAFSQVSTGARPPMPQSAHP